MKKIAILGCVAALLLSNPVLAQSVRTIGVIDTAVEASNFKNVVLEHVSTNDNANRLRQSSGYTHGSETYRNLVWAVHPTKTNPIRIIWSSPYFTTGSNSKTNTLLMNWNLANAALEEFAKNGVKYVCTTFVTKDAVQARRFIDNSKRLGLIVVSSVGNGELRVPYPAVFNDVISVGSINVYTTGLVDAKATYVVDGKSVAGPKGYELDSSSIAAARQCGKLAR